MNGFVADSRAARPSFHFKDIAISRDRTIPPATPPTMTSDAESLQIIIDDDDDIY